MARPKSHGLTTTKHSSHKFKQVATLHENKVLDHVRAFTCIYQNHSLSTATSCDPTLQLCNAFDRLQSIQMGQHLVSDNCRLASAPLAKGLAIASVPEADVIMLDGKRVWNADTQRLRGCRDCRARKGKQSMTMKHTQLKECSNWRFQSCGLQSPSHIGPPPRRFSCRKVSPKCGSISLLAGLAIKWSLQGLDAFTKTCRNWYLNNYNCLISVVI